MLAILFRIPLSFFLLQYITISYAYPPPHTPTEEITLKCGTSGKMEAPDGRVWVGDVGSVFAPFLHANDSSVITTNLSPFWFSTSRVLRHQSTYTFPVTAGPKFIRLYFNSETHPGFAPSESVFSVESGPHTLLSHFTPTATISKEFCLNVERGGALNLTFIPSPHAYAFISGIEVVSMPPFLYYTRSDDIGITTVGGTNRFYINNETAMETVYRLNVGGREIPPMADSGMFRTWLTDDDYVSAIGCVPCNGTIAIKQNFRTPKYTAPDELYMTSRSMGNNKTRNERYNLTWEFPVELGFMYLVRLHFCEIESAIEIIGDREFHIFIDDSVAEAQADVIEWAGGNGIPVYRDYVVSMEGDGEGILSLALHPNAEYRTRYSDAILNGVEMLKLNDSHGSLAKIDPNSKRLSSFTVAAISSTVVVVMAISGVTIFKLRNRASSDRRHTRTVPGEEGLCRHFSLSQIRTATENFSDRCVVGAGGFGKVYRGVLDGATGVTVAIKRLTRGSKQGAREFWTEINMLSQLRHTHLVSLIGYCDEHDEMILVYDFMAGGTFSDHLYKNGTPLSWKQRLEVCTGAAKGLEYLHAGEQHRIIHRDIKSSNILLDENWVAKISDFGLSKLEPNQSWTHISTDVKGTFGYLDPEYYWTRRLTEKSDVFAFGVVLLEALCGRAAVDATLEEEEMHSLCLWAQRSVKAGDVDRIVDPDLKGEISSQCLAEFVDIAMRCLRASRIERPTMNEVVSCLELALALLESTGDGNDNADGISLRNQIRFFNKDGDDGAGRLITVDSHTLCFSVDASELS